MWVGDIYNSKVEPRYRIEIGTSMHKEIVFLEDAEEFAISLLQKIDKFRHQQAAQQAIAADAPSKV